jgi:CDP-diacylglycerol--serine O-phosphatidyltransferase
MTASAPPRHFSMIRGFHLADFLTLANAGCGVAAVFLAMVYVADGSLAYFFAAAALAPAALIFDTLDGRVARWRQQHSPLGRELDSLADVISFGVAPATLAFAAGMRGGWDWIALVYFVCCGVSRLARYNVTAEALSGGEGKVKYFEGTPIPTSIAIVGMWAVAFALDRTGEDVWLGGARIGPWILHPLALVYVASGSAMISATLRVPKP